MGNFIYNDKNEITGYNCDLCNNMGGNLKEKNGYRFWEVCNCLKIKEAISRLKLSGLGELLKIRTFENYETKENWQKDILLKAKNFVNSEDKWFAILGQSGVGKSHICTAISKELLKSGKSLRYMRWLDDGNKLKRNVMNTEIYENFIEEYKNVEVLYIDDFFKSENGTKPTPADIKIANEILNYRYDMALSNSKRYITLLSSERTIEQLAEYDIAIAGRIIELTKPNNLIQIIGKEKNFRLK